MFRIALVSVLLVTAACSAPDPSSPASSPAPSETSSASATPRPDGTDEQPEERFPGYNSRLPRNPRRLAAVIVGIYRRLPKEIDRWLADGGRTSRRATDEVHRGALLQQRSFRLLVRKGRLYRRVDRSLPRRIRRIVARHVNAQQQLSSLATPVEPPVRWKTYRPESPHALRRYYRAGQKRFRVPWQVLAAVNAVESRFGRILGPSSAGALGPMQFMPATWDIYGRGDIMDPRDSIIAAARYLSASGAPEDMRGALFAYNRSDAYVQAILTYAREIQRDRRSYYGYYFWEVFVRTTEGDLRLTGPKS
jgi:hypothetical protein